MHHFLVIFVTSGSYISPWWKHASPFGHFCHRSVLQQPVVTTCTRYWSFLSPRCSLPTRGDKLHHFLVFFVTAVSFLSPRCPFPARGDNMHHFLVIFVTAMSFTSPWRQLEPLFGHFCYSGVLYQPVARTRTTFWSFWSPRCPLPDRGVLIHHFMDIFVTAVSFINPW